PTPVPLLFFFTEPPTTVTYPLSLHDALPILEVARREIERDLVVGGAGKRSERHAGQHDLLGAVFRATNRIWETRVGQRDLAPLEDRKSTRLNSSHDQISYAVFCLKKKNNKNK